MADQATKGTVFLQRPDLHQVLYSAAAKVAPTRFGTHVTGIAQNSGAADITWEKADKVKELKRALKI